MDVAGLDKVVPFPIIAVAVLLTFFYYVGSAAYCVYLHPLAKYPGPFWSKFSTWPSYYHTVRGDRHIWIWQCHQIYGPVFRYNQNGLRFNSPKAFRDIYESRSNVKKGRFYEIAPRKAGKFNTWDCVDKALHARKRRILNAAFSDKALKAAEPYIVQHADRWCQLLLDLASDEWSAPKDMAEWSDYLVLDILGELCFSRSFNTKEPDETGLKFIPKLMMDYASIMHGITRSPFQEAWLWLKPRGLDKVTELAAPKNVRIFQKFADSCLATRMDEEKDLQAKDLDRKDIRKDMLHFLFQAKDPETGGPGYTREELVEENNLLIFAGADTTSTTFAAMFFYLTRNWEVYQRLTQEIRTTFKSAEEIHSGPQLTSCHYLRAFIDETLRMNPPVSSDPTREVLTGGIDIEEQYLPKGTDVGVSLYCLHHNEEIFTNAFQFKPERWIIDEKAGVTPESIATYESAFVPFSIGVRGCPGKNLAYLELSIVMAKVLFLSDVRAVEGDDLGAGKADLIWGRRDESHFQTRDVFVSAREGPTVQFKLRQT